MIPLCRVLADCDSAMLVDTASPFGNGQVDHARRFHATFQKISSAEHHDVSGDNEATDPAIRVRFEPRSKTGYVVNASPWEAAVELRFAGGDRMAIALSPFGLQSFTAPRSSTGIDGWDSVRGEHDRSLLLAWCQEMQDRLNLAESLTFTPCAAIRNPGFNLVDANGWPANWKLFRGHGIEMTLTSQIAGTQDVALQIATHRSRFWNTPPVGCVQSAPFHPPVTGRIALKGRIAVAPGTQTGQIQFAVIDQANGERIPIESQFTATGVASANAPIWYDFIMEPELGSPSEKRNVCLRIELHDGGCIYLDHIEAYDSFLNNDERTMLRQLLAAARTSIDQHNFSGVDNIRMHPLTRVLMSEISLVSDTSVSTSSPSIAHDPPPTTTHSNASTERDAIFPVPLPDAAPFPDTVVSPDLVNHNVAMIGGTGQTLRTSSGRPLEILNSDHPNESNSGPAKLDINHENSTTSGQDSATSATWKGTSPSRPGKHHVQPGLFDRFRTNEPNANETSPKDKQPVNDVAETKETLPPNQTKPQPQQTTPTGNAPSPRRSASAEKNSPPRQIGLFEMIR
ncbi:MAG: hypothetical protein R3C05_28915, partial [Pirellulaceae bacterium]